MAKRATVEPRWLDAMLIVWGRTLPGARGWYKTCPMLQSGIPSNAKSYEPWDLQPKDYDDLAAAIGNLEHKHACVIRMAYKPWAREEMLRELEQYHVTPRTHQRWLQDAAEILEAAMSATKEKKQCLQMA